jgi:pterin-4a-carbinolamine dehydratase
MSAQASHAGRELDSRISDGIHVRLMWDEHDGRVTVSVTDAKTGVAFVVEVRDGDRAAEVFHHPFAFAAWRGVLTSPVAGDALAA